MYTRSTQLYDKLYHFKDYEGDSAKLVATLKQAHVSAKTLLEVACGTGMFTQYLAREYAVEGLDISPDMLDAARRRLPRVPFHLSDIVDFTLDRRFDIVACLFSSIAYVRTPGNFLKTVGTLARHVAPGGILVIEPFFTLDTYWVNRVTMNLVNEPDLKISWMYVSERIGREARLNIHYLVGTPDGVEHFTEVHNLGLFSQEEYREAFGKVGMSYVFDEKGPAGRGLYVAKAAG